MYATPRRKGQASTTELGADSRQLLTGIVTEKGICYPPFTESIAALFADGKDEN